MMFCDECGSLEPTSLYRDTGMALCDTCADLHDEYLETDDETSLNEIESGEDVG
jgi:NMD protein affecting ribosome stability and mRNA decay